MSATLENLAAEIGAALAGAPVRECQQQLCEIVARALTDAEFVAAHLPERKPGADPREVLFEDPVSGFCICGHVYGSQAHGEPHDHGSSWAIYGQASGKTVMTDWNIVDPGSASAPKLVEKANTYTLLPGDVHFYDVGDVHSPSRDAPVKLVRIEGANLDHIERSNIAVAPV